MSLPKPSKDAIYNVVSNKEYLFYKPNFEIRGWYRFCSGAVVAGVGGFIRNPTFNSKAKRLVLDESLVRSEPAKKVYSLSAYFDLRREVQGSSHLDLPQEYIHDYVLEGVLRKASTGEGGTDMWAGNTHNTHTFALADRDPETRTTMIDKQRAWQDRVSCKTFALYLKELEKQGIVRLTQLSGVTGAHGGTCTSWLFMLNVDPAREYLKERILKVNAHLKYLHEYREALMKDAHFAPTTEEQVANQAIINNW